MNPVKVRAIAAGCAAVAAIGIAATPALADGLPPISDPRGTQIPQCVVSINPAIYPDPAFFLCEPYTLPNGTVLNGTRIP